MSEQVDHSPGPWTFDDGDSDAFGIFDANGKSICYLSENPSQGSGLNGQKVDHANAQLISAAPGLLEACCVGLQLAYEKLQKTGDDSDYETISSAIAKALGQEQS